MIQEKVVSALRPSNSSTTCWAPALFMWLKSFSETRRAVSGVRELRMDRKSYSSRMASNVTRITSSLIEDVIGYVWTKS